ncbi:LytR family transcriptional regulator [Nocardioides humilatus]|uniref:LytR family transcriptional regulator n=1 Tax=Nocardioides humilatus TaxID=2607660 RepID=A0A5B1LAQ4_9ACTN|nr:LCP family protein [Nocardioides humilatus]KAA1417813.1 LytR family transcriptional regulator [Nocardioides humilatus]
MAGTASPGRPGGARRASRSVRVSRRERRQLRAAASESYVGKRARRPGDPVLETSASPAGARPRGGRRALRPRERRTRGLPGTLGLTFISAMIPGTGYLFAKRKLAGWIVLVGWALVFGAVVWYFFHDHDLAASRSRVVELVFNPRALRIITLVIAVLLTVWLFVVWTSYRLIRPRERPQWHTVVGNLAVIVFCLIFAAPVVRGAQYAVATADFVDKVFTHNEVATTPKDRTAKDPWAGTDRVNVLLLGGDGGEGREGVRTDSMILLSMDTQTGKAVTFSLPRNMANAQFPEDSPLHDAYPYGFQNGDPANGEYMLNAVYRNVPAVHPGILGKSTNEGADAIKQAVEGTLGIPVEYYVLVNLEGFKEVVDAMGGVTVNINEPIAIGGSTDAGDPPDDYLAPGPDQHLNGFQALWFARGRWGSDDYERMDRQRCMVDAIVQSADPGSLLLRYLDLLKAGKEIVYTDIPRELASAFVELALRVKDAKVKSVVFKSSAEFSSADPDFDWMRDIVQRAIDPPAKKHHGEKKDPADDPDDACAYNPTGETVEDAEAHDAAY